MRMTALMMSVRLADCAGLAADACTLTMSLMFKVHVS